MFCAGIIPDAGVELRLGDSHYGNELGSIFIALSTGRE